MAPRLVRAGRKLADTQANIRLALREMAVRLRYDSFAGCAEIVAGDAPARLADEAVDDLWARVERRFEFRPNYPSFRRIIGAIAREDTFHPVAAYLDALASDGVPRLDRSLATYGGAADTEFNRAVGAVVLTAAVRRIRRPGARFDEMLVLGGKQGANKSSFVAALVPERRWFTDQVRLNKGTKQHAQRIVTRKPIPKSCVARLLGK